ncbi:hypothetical protein MMC16_003491 [Acarospora aff. strigata]|nr:hypothetical protein [Acarospora aff. strigata]
MVEYATLIKPPKVDPSKSAIENVLELTPLSAIGPDIFTNTRPLWHPPGARGIYGGAVIAQCLSAAQRTVPAHFTVHSMHCYFVLAGDAEIPILYHVEHVRSGKSFATRTVQARQRGKCIFTVTMSFVREGSGGKKLVEHEADMPDVPGPDEREGAQGEVLKGGDSGDGPFQSQRIEILNSAFPPPFPFSGTRSDAGAADADESPNPHEKKTRQWIKARGRISPDGGHQAHLSALAYMSDSYFIGTVSRVHNLWRFAAPSTGGKPPSVDAADKHNVLKHLSEIVRLEQHDNAHRADERPQIGMMVSLDHTIYFHNPRDFRADEWMFTEMESPWAGDGRGLVLQKIWSREGKLIASCVQEGLVRLKQDDEGGSSKSKSKL